MSVDTTPNKKFEKAKLLFDQGLINEFKELFDVAPYTLIAKKLNTSHNRFKGKLDRPQDFKISEIHHVAEILKISPLALCELILNPKTNAELKK